MQIHCYDKTSSGYIYRYMYQNLGAILPITNCMRTQYRTMNAAINWCIGTETWLCLEHFHQITSKATLTAPLDLLSFVCTYTKIGNCTPNTIHRHSQNTDTQQDSIHLSMTISNLDLIFCYVQSIYEAKTCIAWSTSSDGKCVVG